MKITTATRHFFGDVREFFAKKGDTRILPTNYASFKEPYATDLLVFTGGEDVDPSRYGSNYSTYFSAERDQWEFDVLEAAVNTGKIKAKRILGICRGLQLMNVFLGGTLVTDIMTMYGRPHDMVHPITHLGKSPTLLSFLKSVNSLHHQAARNVPARGKILAAENSTGSPEIILFRPNMLGVQFHPELFPDSHPDKEKIADALAQWVGGKAFVVNSKPSSQEEDDGSPYKFFFKTSPSLSPEEFADQERRIVGTPVIAETGRIDDPIRWDISSATNTEESEG